MAQRVGGWMVLHALLWMGVGAGGLAAVTRWRGEGPSLADLADEAAARMDGLDLTSEQSTALAAIREQWRADVLREESSWQERVATAAATADRQIEALLSPEQARRWRQLAVGGIAK